MTISALAAGITFWPDLRAAVQAQQEKPGAISPRQNLERATAATYTYHNTTTGAITDNGCAGGTNLTRTFTVSDNFVISDLNVGINATHTSRGQVRVSLTSPAGTTVQIIATSGDTDDHYSVTLDSASGNTLDDNSADTNPGTSPPTYQRTAAPSVSLNSFNDQNAAGTWTLTICDNTAGTTGNLTSASLYFTTASITGTVYYDYNANGARNTSGTAPNLSVDSGVPGVVVTVYDSTGTSRGTATTDSAGAYTIDPGGTAPYRLEFTSLPSGYSPSTTGTNNLSTVRFLTSASTSGVDLGITSNSIYSQNNPLLVTSCYVNGSNTGSDDVLVAINYDKSSSVQHISLASQIGTTWGLAYQRKTQKLFAAAALKRQSGLGAGKNGTRGDADDISSIYVIDYSSPGTNGSGTVVTAQTIDVNSFSGVNVGTNPRVGTSPANDLAGTTTPAHDYGVLEAVAKRGIGGIAISDDENTLYVIGLNSAGPQLISLNVSNLASVTLNSVVSIPNPGCTTGDSYAPWGIRLHNGELYLGTACTADVSQNALNLRAYVQKYSGGSFSNVDIDSTTSADYIQLYYDRTCKYMVIGGRCDRAEWTPWVDTFNYVMIGSQNQVIKQQPIVSDIEFAPDGSMILGLMDRTAHQHGTGNYSPTSTDTAFYEEISAGSILKVCNSGGSYIPEGKSGCSRSITTPHDEPDATDAAPGAAGVPVTFFNNYINNGGDGHGEIFFGGLAALPGASQVIMTAQNPSAGYYQGGWRWLSTTTGATADNFILYTGTGGTSAELGKANGLGDSALLRDPAPIHVGNRIWADADNDGIQDAGENPIQNVAVQLWADTNADGAVDTQVGAATTDSSGNYYFGGPANTNMSSSCGSTSISVRVNASANDASETTGGTVTTNGNPIELSSSLGAAGFRFTNVTIPRNATITSATLQFTSNNGDSGTTVNSTIYGQATDNAAIFTTTASSISSRTRTSSSVSWSNIGTWTAGATTNATSPDITTIIQEIVDNASWLSGNSMALILLDNASSSRRRIRTYDNATTTAPLLSVTYQCRYVLSPSTKYEIRVPSSNFSSGQPLNGYLLSDVNSDSTTNGDLRDSDGTYINGNVAIGFTTGSYGQNDHTFDFGFTTTATVSLGNRVWNDINNNGALNVGESGIASVALNLYNSAGTTLLDTTTTDVNGYYSFPGLTSGTAYLVEIAASNFNTGGALEGFRSSTGTNGSSTGSFEGAGTPNPDTNNSDTDDNGTTTGTLGSGGYVRAAAAVTLTTASEPTGETNGAGDLNADSNHNLTVDFGFFESYSVGNRIFYDTDNDGTLDTAGTAEVGISGVSLSIFLDANNDGTPDSPSSPVGTVTSDSNGYYRFDNLAPTNYVVRVNAANFQSGGVLHGYQTSTTTEADPDSNTDSNDNALNPSSLFNPQYSTNGVLSAALTLGSGAVEPTSESDVAGSGLYAGQGTTDSRGNLTVDFGFYSLTLGNLVFDDYNEDGDYDDSSSVAPDATLSGATVRLYQSDGTTEVNIGPDGILGTSDDASGGVTTGSNGIWQFSGLAAGSYIVKVTPPSGYKSTVDTANTGTPNSDTDHDDNGSGTAAGVATSGTITLTGGGEPTITNSTGTSTNNTLDFGFAPTTPTAVGMVSSQAGHVNDDTLIEWETGFETNNLGFNVWREVNGVRLRANAQLIAGSALTIARPDAMRAERQYYWWDEGAAPLPGARYWIEAIDMAGASQWHGPVTPDWFSTDAGPRAQKRSPLLTEIGPGQRLVTQQRPRLARLPGNDQPESAADDSLAAPVRRGPHGARFALKLDVRKEGWYRVTQPELVAAGLNPGVNPHSLQLYFNDEPVPITINGEADGRLDPADSLEFYGLGMDTPLTDTAVYWLTADAMPGLRIPKINTQTESAAPGNFPYTIERRDRTLYFAGLRNGDAENFFGSVIYTTPVVSELMIRHADAAATAPLTLEIALQGVSEDPHVVDVGFNGAPVGQFRFQGREHAVRQIQIAASLAREGANLVTLVSPQPEDISLLDTLRLTWAHSYTADDNSLRLLAQAGQSIRVDGFSDAGIRLFDVTDAAHLTELHPAIGQDENGWYLMTFVPGAGQRELFATTAAMARRVAAIRLDTPSNLRQMRRGAGAEYMILTTAALSPAAEVLRQARQATGMSTMLVDIEDIYDEFSFGMRDTNAIRQFFRHAVSNWKQPPRYVVLLGDSSYDPRDYLGYGQRDLIPSGRIDTALMEASSDEWLADVDNNGEPDLSLGRLPAATPAEAIDMVRKIIAWEKAPPRPDTLLVSDENDEFDFEQALTEVKTSLPGAITTREFIRGRLPVAAAREALLEQLNRGPGLVDYLGHGSITAWRGGLLRADDARALRNENSAGIFIMMSCLNGMMTDPSTDSLGEALLKNPRGGAIAVWASSGLTNAQRQTSMNQQILRQLFIPGIRLGDAVTQARRAARDPQVRLTWILLGDPAMRVRWR
ncbi:MAG: C25 family cysteine peptidase [Blastocatellia bacterium]